jgi:hypothetical protein
VRELHDNRAYYEQQALTDKADYEALGFRPEEDAAKIGKTVVVDFDSGHYTPSEAWRRTASAWRKLGYTVEFNPEGRTA